MDRLRTLRNVAIIVSIAAAVRFLPGGGQVADAFAATLWVVFAAGLGYLGYRLYRERRVDLYALGRYRGLLYGSLAVGYVALAARVRMWQTSLGEFAWFVLIGLCAWALLVVYRYSRTY